MSTFLRPHQSSLVEEMIKYGAEVHSVMLFSVCNFETADWKIQCAEQVEDYTTIVRLFLEAGADPNVKDSGGKTPLDAIKGDGLEEIERLLIQAQNR